MRAVVWHGGSRLRLEQLAEPEAGPGMVTVDVAIAGICGSDLHPYRGHPGPRRPPLVLGHELVGTVAGRPGRYAIFPLVTCGTCEACRAGMESLCASRGLLGLDRPGAFAERVAVAESALTPVPEGMDDRTAALVEPLATSVSALRLDEPRAGQRVLVIGCGAIGALATYACTALDVEVVAVDPVAGRRELAQRLGAAATAASVDEVAPQSVDLVIDAVGAAATWCGAIAAVRSGGRVAVLGLAQGSGEMPVGELVRRGITVRGHYAYTRSDFDAALGLLASRPLALDWIDVLPLERAAEGFERMANPAGSVVKVMLAAEASA